MRWAIIEKNEYDFGWKVVDVVSRVTTAVERRIAAMRAEGREIGVVDTAYAAKDEDIYWPETIPGPTHEDVPSLAPQPEGR